MKDAQGSFLALMERSQDFRKEAVKALQDGDVALARKYLVKSKVLDDHLLEVFALMEVPR